MKKILFLAFMALGMSAMAQHVTPLSIQLAEVKLDSLRTLYINEPTMYRAALEVVAQSLAKNAEEIKAAKAELKGQLRSRNCTPKRSLNSNPCRKWLRSSRRPSTSRKS